MRRIYSKSRTHLHNTGLPISWHLSDTCRPYFLRLGAKSLDLRENFFQKVCVTGLTESGVGKTYTYIKTMYELNKHYGWSKFIIVVPSIAVREGVCKSFSMTQEHFAEEYGKKIRLFIYNSSQLAEYKDGYIVKFIDGRDDSVEFVNGIKIYAGDVIGRGSEEQLRRLQICETILSHIERERQLFHMGIKKQGSVPQCRSSESS